MSCQNCGQNTDNRYCSIKCNNAHYNQLHIENKRIRLKKWRARNKKNITAVCRMCNKEFISTRNISKDCSKECYNMRRTVERKSRSCEQHQQEQQLSRARYLKMRNDINRRLKVDLRSRLNRAISGMYKSGSAVSDLGCSITELKTYLESKFQPGMTWENKGIHGWHVDHIIPLSSFNLENRDELLKACHYTNLQPLWAKDNLSKGDKL